MNTRLLGIIAGLIGIGAALLLVALPAYSEGLLTNAEFDANIDGWTLETIDNGSYTWTGPGYLQVNEVDYSDEAFAYQTLSLSAYSTYSFTASIWCQYGSVPCYIKVRGITSTLAYWPVNEYQTWQTVGGLITTTSAITADIGFVVPKFFNSNLGYADYIRVYDVTDPNSIPTSTPTPYATATNFAPTANPAICVTATPTPTATPRGTPWPTPTYIAAGATVTPTATPTGTVIAPSSDTHYDSGVQAFSTGMQPWSIIGGAWQLHPNRTRWTLDQQYGEIVKVSDGYDMWTGFAVYSKTTTLPGAFAHSLPYAVSLPLRISGSGKYHEVRAGERAYLDFWYYDPNYYGSGSGAWLSSKQWRIQLTNEWKQWTINIMGDSSLGGTGKATRVAIVETLVDESGSVDDAEAGRDADDLSEAYVDSLRVMAGTRTLGLTICGTNTFAGGTSTGTRVCVVRIDPYDVFSNVCPVPSDWLNIGAWLGWTWCRVSRYFEFVKQNYVQLEQMSTRTVSAEPMGTIIELQYVFGDLRITINDVLRYHQKDFWKNRSLDFTSLFRWERLDTPPSLTVQTDTIDYRADCPPLLAQSSEKSGSTACWVIGVVRHRFPGVAGLMQWIIDVAFIIWLGKYVTDSLFARG